MKIVDAVIILFLLLGAAIGFKRGFIRTLVSFIGVFITIILAFYLKGPVVNFMYEFLPFFNYGGFTILNVFVYESIAFLLVYIILASILGIIINITGIVEKILKLTVILGLLSKVLGAIAGVLEMLLFIFISTFVLARFNFSKPYIMESKAARVILARTPVISGIAAPTYLALDEIYKLQKDYANTEDKEQYNIESLRILVKYRIVSKDQARKFVNDGKIKLSNPNGFVIM